jgi:hypothetical protein
MLSLRSPGAEYYPKAKTSFFTALNKAKREKQASSTTTEPETKVESDDNKDKDTVQASGGSGGENSMVEDGIMSLLYEMRAMKESIKTLAAKQAAQADNDATSSSDMPGQVNSE